MSENEALASGCTSQPTNTINSIRVSVEKITNRKEIDWLPPDSYWFTAETQTGFVDSCPIDVVTIQYYLQQCYQAAAYKSSDPRTKIASVVIVPRKQSIIKKRIINKMREYIGLYDHDNFNGAYHYYPTEFLNTKYAAYYGVNYWMGESYDKASVLNSPDKYYYMEHAERSAIAQAQLYYTSAQLRDNKAIMIGTCLACADCGRAIIHSGIKLVICHAPPMHIMADNKRWKDSISAAFRMFKKYGVKVWFYDHPIHHSPLIMMNGEIFDPSKPRQESDT